MRTEAEKLLYRAIRELAYVEIAETLEQCKSAEGSSVIKLGMKLLGINSLENDTLNG